MLASLITDLEDRPFSPTLRFTSASPSIPPPQPENPYFAGLQCRLAHASDTIPRKIRSAIAKAPYSKKATSDLLEWVGSPEGDNSRYFVQTAQAVDVIRGGVKVNALPEIVSAIVNYRIDVSSSVKETQDRLVNGFLRPLAERYNLTLDAFGRTGEVIGSKGLVTVRGIGPLEPAPVSPSTIDDPRWRTLAGTVRHVFGNDSVVAPGLEVGNTDTQFVRRSISFRSLD